MTATLPIQWHLIIAYGFGLLLLILLGRLLFGPIRWVIRMLLTVSWSGLIGLILLILFNLLFSRFGYYIPLNPITALVVGFLKLPGLALLILLQHIS